MDLGDTVSSVKKSLDLVIYEKLKEKILRCEWNVGERISINEIADEYQISRTPVIQSLKRMCQEGILEHSSTGKFFVPNLTMSQVCGICDTRLLFERYAVTQICKNGLSEAQYRILCQLADGCITAKLDNDSVEYHQQDLELHRRIVETVENECLYQLYIQVQGRFMGPNYLLIPHTIQMRSNSAKEHFELIDALSAKQTDLALSIIDKHIINVKNRILNSMQ